MKKSVSTLAVLAALCWSGFPTLQGQEAPTSPAVLSPLAPFESLIGGQWHLDGSYQELEWGLDGMSVKSKSYVMVGGESQLVSEGLWFWHPGEQQIKGIFTAVDMPVVFFDYTTRFEDEKMVSDLVTYDAAGARSEFVEVWDLVDERHYVWTLSVRSPDGLQEVMAGTYERH